MSRKRTATGDQLTGGTKDVNPQYLSGLLTMSAANTATEITLGTPIVRVGGAGASASKSIIMEILKVFVQMPEVDVDAAAATSRTLGLAVMTASSGATPALPNLDNPRVIAWFMHSVRNAFTAAGTGILDLQNDSYCFDCTDGAGHGILVATDNLFIVANTAGQTAASSFRFKILYRFKEVSLVEYIGIVQSQQ